MPGADANQDLEALIKATETNRLELKKLRQKMEDLQAAIQSAERTQADIKSRQSSSKPKKNFPE
jgi:prefoldin subunit 5